MTFLLDSHVLLWAVDSPEKLSKRAAEIVRGENEVVLISIATPWELSIKANEARKNDRLDISELLEDFERALLTAGYRVLEATVPQVIRAGLLPLHHRDPFDRLLAAQALDLRIPIVSRDPIFDRYGVKRIWN
jgi:PIN domain nuclease of toxin-antitoxin system